MKMLWITLVFSTVFITTKAAALEVLTEAYTDTQTLFDSTTYSYDATTDIFTIDMSEDHPILFDFHGTLHQIFDTRATFTAVIDGTGHLSSGSLTWYGTVPTIAGINFDGDKIIEADVIGASYGEYLSWGPGFQFDLDITHSGVYFGDTAIINLFGTWAGLGGGASPWDNSYSNYISYTHTNLVFYDVPEPSAWALLGLGLLGLLYVRRRTCVHRINNTFL